MYQLIALGISLGVSFLAGLVVGFIINIEFLCSGMKDTELFEDFFFFHTPYEVETEAAPPAITAVAPTQSYPPPPPDTPAIPLTPGNH